MTTKKINSKLLFVLPLLAIILLSGCTSGGTGVGGTQGVIIDSWEPDFTTVDSYDRVQIALKVKNYGGAVAKDVEATLTGIDPNDWGVYNPILDLGDLQPADPRYNTQGGEKTAFLNLEAPELNEGVLQDFHPRVRVAYEYSTSATKTITIVGEEELRRLADSGETLPTSTTVYSSGPITVDVQVGNLIKASQTSSRRTEFPMNIVLTNVGGGSIQEKESIPGTALQDIVALNLDLPSGLRFTGDCRNIDRAEFFRGDTATVSCNVEITDDRIIAEEKIFRIELGYEYLVDAVTAISVRGTDDPGTSPPGGSTSGNGWHTQSV